LWKEKATEDTPTPPTRPAQRSAASQSRERLRRLEEFTEMKKYNTPSEFSPSGAAGPHPPDLSGVLSVAKKNWRRSNK